MKWYHLADNKIFGGGTSGGVPRQSGTRREMFISIIPDPALKDLFPPPSASVVIKEFLPCPWECKQQEVWPTAHVAL